MSYQNEWLFEAEDEIDEQGQRTDRGIHCSIAVASEI